MVIIFQILYAQAPDKEQIAMFLVMHYYADEIKDAQEENWREKHFEAGKVPYGVELDDISTYGDNQGIKWWVRSHVNVPGREPEEESAEISRAEMVRINQAKGEDRNRLFDRLASEHIGRKVVKDISYPSFEQLKESIFGGELAVAYFNAMLGTEGYVP